MAAAETRCIKTLSSGYNAGTGYDQTTGLGSVECLCIRYRVAFRQVSARPFHSTASPDPVTSAGHTGLTATVRNSNGDTPSEEQSPSRLDRRPWGPRRSLAPPESASATLNITGGAAGLSSGSNTITGVYGGDGANHAATATTVVHLVSSSAAKPTINGLVDAASYREAYAPGMVLSIFGSNLALSTASASTVPLPISSLDNVSVTVNRVAAPLYYISPSQLNVQIPYETPTSGKVTVRRKDNGETASCDDPDVSRAPATTRIRWGRHRSRPLE